MDKSTESRVNVLMPTFNSQNTVVAAIKSVLTQSHSNLVLHIRDDCSVDGTWELVQRMAKLDSRIRAKKNDRNVGVSVNCNLILSDCKSGYICFTAGDDIMHPGKIAHQLSIFNEFDDVSVVFHQYNIKNLASGQIETSNIRPGIYKFYQLEKVPMPTITAMIRWEENFAYRYNLDYPLADSGFFLDYIISQKSSAFFSNQIHLDYQKSGAGLNAKDDKSAKKMAIIDQQIGYCKYLIVKYPYSSQIINKRILNLLIYKRRAAEDISQYRKCLYDAMVFKFQPRIIVLFILSFLRIKI